MHITRGTMCAITALLLFAGALVAVSGCARQPMAQITEATSSVEPTASVTATVGAGGSSTNGDSGSSGAGASGTGGSSGSSKIDSKAASSLDAELSAIQSELDKMSLPSDSDFDSIGSGLK
ncbi:MAG: hypothetical protein WCJ13_08825 [Coriobacteriia bacterium]